MSDTISYVFLTNSAGQTTATLAEVLSLSTETPVGQPPTVLTSSITELTATDTTATATAIATGSSLSTGSNPGVASASTSSSGVQSSASTPVSSSSGQPNGTVSTTSQTSNSSLSIPTITPHNGLVSFTTTISPTAPGPTTVTFTGKVLQTTKSIGGPVAGAAIAGLVVGAIIGILIMLFGGKKWSRKSPSSRFSKYVDNSSSHGFAQSVVGGPKEKIVTSTTSTEPEYLLPQPKDDQSMGADAKKLFIHIDNHVENFYHNNSLRENISPQSEEESLLLSRKTRHFAIKRLICREMLAAMAWECKPEHSLLPGAVVAIAQKMSRGSLDQSSKSCSPLHSTPTLTTVAYEVAWSRWRVSTALLLPKDDGAQKVEARKYWVDRLVQKLQPFQVDDPGTSATIKEDLYAICKLAEELASLICSQPGRWEFDWRLGDGRDNMVIFPGFVRTTDSKGRGLERPRRPLEAQKMQ